MSLPPAPVKVSLPAPPTKISSVVPPYTDATARQYLIDTYHWSVVGNGYGGFFCEKGEKGKKKTNTPKTKPQKNTPHSLGG
jgi:hypothetical protein